MVWIVDTGRTHYELRGCHASKSVFPFRYERVAAKQSLTSRLAAVRSRDVGRQAAPTTGGLGAPMFHPPTARLFHEPTGRDGPNADNPVGASLQESDRRH